MRQDLLLLDNTWPRFRSFGIRLMLGLHERQSREYHFYIVLLFFY